MSADPFRRFKSAQEMARALNGKGSVHAGGGPPEQDGTSTVGELDRTEVLEAVPRSRGIGTFVERIRRHRPLKRVPKKMGRLVVLAVVVVLLVTSQFLLGRSRPAQQPPKAVPSPTTVILPPNMPPGLADALEELNRAVGP
jgi:hypothetical protein